MDQRESDQGDRLQGVLPSDGVAALERFSGVPRDLYIEVFGVLVPGFFFLILLFFALVLPVEYAVGTIPFAVTTERELRYMPMLGLFIADHAIVSFIILLFFGYVAGHIFYRSDPKNPDFASIKRLPWDVRESGCVRSVDDRFKASQRERYNGAEEYPYGHLYEYLTQRGFDRLADYIQWSGDDFKVGPDAANSDRKRRSKHLINTMKLNIKRFDRLLFFEITRNEAHIRLMSSVWYLSLYVWVAGLVGLLISAVALAWIFWGERSSEFYYGAAEAVLFPLACIVIAYFLRRSIEGFFHYQRVREIIFVLQALSMVEDRPQRFPRRSDRKLLLDGKTPKEKGRRREAQAD